MWKWKLCSTSIKLHNFVKHSATLPDFRLDINFILLFFNRTAFNASEDISFFSTHSPPSSPRPCPISPCRNDSMSSLSMENDFFDFNTFVNKDKKPFSPARKKLNMDVFANQNSPSSKTQMISSERNYLQSINSNVASFGLRMSSSGAFKRSECSEDSLSPIQNKRHKSENQSPASSSIFSISAQQNQQQQPLRKTVSIMNVLTSSSEMLRKNRL